MDGVQGDIPPTIGMARFREALGMGQTNVLQKDGSWKCSGLILN